MDVGELFFINLFDFLIYKKLIFIWSGKFEYKIIIMIIIYICMLIFYYIMIRLMVVNDKIW